MASPPVQPKAPEQAAWSAAARAFTDSVWRSPTRPRAGDCPSGASAKSGLAGRASAVAIGIGLKRRQPRSAHVLADSDEGPFLRTGDLGFFDDGELFVTGRVKDLIVIWGRNLYPQDIEHTVLHCNEVLKPDGGAAFSIDVGGEERLVIVQEVLRPKRIDPTALVETIRRRSRRGTRGAGLRRGSDSRRHAAQDV